MEISIFSPFFHVECQHESFSVRLRERNNLQANCAGCQGLCRMLQDVFACYHAHARITLNPVFPENLRTGKNILQHPDILQTSCKISGRLFLIIQLSRHSLRAVFRVRRPCSRFLVCRPRSGLSGHLRRIRLSLRVCSSAIFQARFVAPCRSILSTEFRQCCLRSATTRPLSSSPCCCRARIHTKSWRTCSALRARRQIRSAIPDGSPKIGYSLRFLRSNPLPCCSG